MPTLLLLPPTMMSTAAGLAFYNHIFPLVSKFVKTSETHVTLSRTVPSGQDITEKRNFSVPLLNNHDVETICCCILEFRNVCHTTRLSLTQGPLKFTYFRQCLDSITRDNWDLITAHSNQTNDGFHQATTELLMQNIKPTDLADQEHYICNCKKPFKYNCHELSSRLQFMNKMMSSFPGANNTPPFTHQDLKNIYFKMMPIEWQHAFINNELIPGSQRYTSLHPPRPKEHLLQNDAHRMATCIYQQRTRYCKPPLHLAESAAIHGNTRNPSPCSYTSMALSPQPILLSKPKRKHFKQLTPN